MPATRSTALERFRANTGSLAKAIGAGRAILVTAVALITGLVVLLIERHLGSGDWKWADALGDLVKLFATTLVIVGLLDWHRQRRWQQADGTDLRSLTLMAHLIASGWSSPKNIGPPDLDPGEVARRLEGQTRELAKVSAGLDDLYQRLTGEGGFEAFLDLDLKRWDFELYYAEGSRARRIHYLSLLVDTHLPGLIGRRDDPELFGLFVALRDGVIQADASSHHADAVIRERILLERPSVLVPYLDAQNALSAIDPVAVLARAIAYASDAVIASGGSPDEWLDQLGFANRCVGAVRNELQWVEDALHVLRNIIRALEADIRDAADRGAADRGASPVPTRVNSAWATGERRT